jgi:ribose transport system substrate-binding protein
MSKPLSGVLAAAALAIAALWSGAAAAGDALAGKTVYILTLTASCETCATFAKTAESGIKAEGAKVITEYVDFGAAATQTQQLNQALSTNPAAILVWPTDQTSLLPALARAKQTNPNVPILIAIYPPDTTDDSLYTAYFGSDEEKTASLLAESLVDGLKAAGKPVKGSVIEITGAPGGYTTTARQKGFDKKLAEIAPDLKIVETQTANWDLSQAQTVATAMFSKYGNDGIVGVYAHSDVMLQGAILAADRAGFKAGKDFVAVGVDCDPVGYANINDGKEFATVLWNPVLLGTTAAGLTVKAASGASVPKVTKLDSLRITKDNTSECVGATVKK